MKSIAFIIPYFGRWPEWFNFYLTTCRYNPSIDWYFFTDCKPPEAAPENTFFIHTTFDNYTLLVSNKLGIDFRPKSVYKLCDIRPALGYLHCDLTESYDFWGFGDVDLIYGDIRHFYTNQLLNFYNSFSTHTDRVSGHFFLLKNTPWLRVAFMRILNWQKLFEDSQYLGLDEAKFARVLQPVKTNPAWLRFLSRMKSRYKRRAYFKEQFSTILSTKPWHDGKWEHPQTWFWKAGKLRNAEDGNREFLYLHFMNWKSNRWLDKSRGEKSAWQGLDQLNHVPYGTECNGFRIERSGFYPL